jgi:hypothetical protein
MWLLFRNRRRYSTAQFEKTVRNLVLLQALTFTSSGLHVLPSLCVPSCWTVIRVRVWNPATYNAVVGGNRNANDSDEHLLKTLRTCRLEVLVERGLDAAIGQVSIRRDAVVE